MLYLWTSPIFTREFIVCYSFKNNLSFSTTDHFLFQLPKTNEYNLLIKLQDIDYVSNETVFICFVCNQTQKPNDGVILKECLHAICKNCVKNVVFGSTQAAIKCPYADVLDKNEKCQSEITQREIMGILSKVDYDTYLNNCVNLIKQTVKNATNCFKPNCYGIGLNKSENQHFFICEICKSVNCISCRVSNIFKICIYLCAPLW